MSSVHTVVNTPPLVPATRWPITALKYHLRRVETGTSVNAVDMPAGDGEIGVLKTSAVYSGVFNPNENKQVVADEAHLVACPVRRGTLIVSRMNTPDLVGAAAAVREDAPSLYLPDRLWQVEFDGLDPVFVDYWTKTEIYRAQVRVAAAGTSASMQNLGQEEFKGFRLACPPLDVQKAIAAYLDRETTRIDALIAKKTRFIALLREKRQALIAQAVTRGLDPDVAMKDSGVDWLGRVPAHWQCGQLRHFARLGSGHTPSRDKTEYWMDCHIPWFTLADVWQLRREGQKVVSDTQDKISDIGIANSSATLHPAGSVMLSRTASVGYPGIMGCDMATSQDFAVWTCGKMLHNEFLYYVLLGMKQELGRIMMGSTHKTIYMPDIEAIRIALPPLQEQQRIAGDLGKKLELSKQLEVRCLKSIELMSERRSALITSAVTGQIDLTSTAS